MMTDQTVHGINALLAAFNLAVLSVVTYKLLSEISNIQLALLDVYERLGVHCRVPVLEDEVKAGMYVCTRCAQRINSTERGD